MDKYCRTCQYCRLQKWTAMPDAPEAPWCSNSKSPLVWKTVGLEKTCEAWEQKRTVENTGGLLRRVARWFGRRR